MAGNLLLEKILEYLCTSKRITIYIQKQNGMRSDPLHRLDLVIWLEQLT